MDKGGSTVLADGSHGRSRTDTQMEPSVFTSIVDGTDRIQAIVFGGSRYKVVFQSFAQPIEGL